MNFIGALIFVFIVFVIAIGLIIKNMLYICSANEVMIFTGGHYRRSDNTACGYRLIKGGRALRIPLMERVDRISLSNISIDVRVSNAYSKGGIPLSVVGVANVKVSGQEPFIHNAIERFLNKERYEIQRIAQETLEGNLRGVLATLTPEEVNEDKTRFAQSLMDEAEQDLNRLGLQLDNLKIQSVTDEKGYLDSIGRKRTAELQRRAVVAEAESKADAAVKAAQSKLGIALSQITKEMQVVKANAEKRIRIAQTNQEALVSEAKSTIGAQTAKVQADVKVQSARIEQVKKQLEADLIQPAMSQMEAEIQKAKASAAKILADGDASVQALDAITNTWKSSGEHARDVFLMQKLETVMKTIISTIKNIKVENITVLDTQSSGGEHGTQTTSLAGRILKLNEELKASMGLDLSQAVKSIIDKNDIAQLS